MSWIRVVHRDEATGLLKILYDRITGSVKGGSSNDSGQSIDNVLAVHSLRPHTLEGHMRLYKGVLHHRENTLPQWYLEVIGVYVSCLNRCDYCVEHHSIGLSRLLDDPQRHQEIVTHLRIDAPTTVFEGRWQEGLRYAKRLTQHPSTIEEDDIQHLRHTGFSDGEILEINQVVSYFNYVNRTVLGLGVTLHGDTLGLSPSDQDDEENWTHQ